uniref:Uncharacterized protein n=1 Tax=Arundo donax TaxID=35708 RepID=A0A0A9CAL9_ARUDO
MIKLMTSEEIKI